MVARAGAEQEFGIEEAVATLESLQIIIKSFDPSRRGQLAFLFPQFIELFLSDGTEPFKAVSLFSRGEYDTIVEKIAHSRVRITKNVVKNSVEEVDKKPMALTLSWLQFVYRTHIGVIASGHIQLMLDFLASLESPEFQAVDQDLQDNYLSITTDIVEKIGLLVEKVGKEIEVLLVLAQLSESETLPVLGLIEIIRARTAEFLREASNWNMLVRVDEDEDLSTLNLKRPQKKILRVVTALIKFNKESGEGEGGWFVLGIDELAELMNKFGGSENQAQIVIRHVHLLSEELKKSNHNIQISLYNEGANQSIVVYYRSGEEKIDLFSYLSGLGSSQRIIINHIQKEINDEIMNGGKRHGRIFITLERLGKAFGIEKGQKENSSSIRKKLVPIVEKINAIKIPVEFALCDGGIEVTY